MIIDPDDLAVVMEKDPAIVDENDAIKFHTGLQAVSMYRESHQLWLAGEKEKAREINFIAHQLTGCDIHPGATIGRHFTIDHGTGVVIGATCVIGDHVKLYQGVTLGAKSFPLDADGNPIKHVPRHPVIEDNVVIYANATVLGRITIGEGCVVGANTWVLEDMAPQTKIYNINRRNKTNGI